MSRPRYRCPQCGNTQSLDVYVETRARLVQREGGHLETDADLAEFHDHEWSDSSTIHCCSCQHHGIAEAFIDVGIDIRVSPDQIAAIDAMLNLAYHDQRDWLREANPTVDYGVSEWPDVAKSKAADFRHIASFAGGLELEGQSDQWRALADEFEASGKAMETVAKARAGLIPESDWEDGDDGGAE